MVSIPVVEHLSKYYSYRIVEANGGRRERLDQQVRVASAAPSGLVLTAYPDTTFQIRRLAQSPGSAKK